MIRRLVLAVLALTLLSTAFAEELRIATSRANIRVGPGVEHRIAQTVRQGTALVPLELAEKYVRVRVADGSDEGWVFYPAQGWSEQFVRDAIELPVPASSSAPPAPSEPSRPLAAAPPATTGGDAVVEQMPVLPAVVSAPPLPAVAPENIALTSLAELGFRSGVRFEGLRGNHQHVLRFPLPRNTPVAAAQLRLRYLASRGLDARSLLRVDVNGVAVFSQPLATEGSQSIAVPIPAAIFAGRPAFVDVTLRASLILSEDRCFDERNSPHFLQLEAGSSLALALGKPGSGVAAAWELLPKRVTVSLPAQVDAAAFTSALVLADRLRSEGHEFDFVRLPELGEIVVASQQNLREIIDEEIEWPEPEANVWLMKRRDLRHIVLSDRHQAWPAELASAGWLPVARSPAVAVHSARPFTMLDLLSPETKALALEDLGLDLSTRFVERTAEWRLPLRIDQLPRGRMPDRLRLTVTAAPIPGERELLLYAYVNDVLQEAFRLEQSGRAQQIMVPLAKRDFRGSFNELRIVVQRETGEGDCRNAVSGYPVQLGADSVMVLGEGSAEPTDFGDLSAHFRGGAELLLGPEVLAAPENVLGFLSALLHDNRYQLDPGRIRVLLDATAPKGPFIRVSESSTGIEDAYVRFDKGRTEVKAHDGRILLDIGQRQEAGVVQIARWGDQRGLWVRPAHDAELPTRGLELTYDSVAFVSPQGVELTISPREQAVAYLEYPEYRDWFEIFGTYRYWFMVLGWLLVTALLVQLYLKVRQHRKTG